MPFPVSFVISQNCVDEIAGYGPFGLKRRFPGFRQIPVVIDRFGTVVVRLIRASVLDCQMPFR